MKEIRVEDILAKALDSLTLTQYLIEKNRFEFALNRAYYTMYYSIQALLFVKKIRIRSLQRTHTTFNRELMLTDELPRGLGKILKKTFKKNQRAEYSYDKVEETDAIEAFTNAEIFFSATVQYLIANNHLQ
ncbi:HEPN domain-containing protein [Dyadobacter bucti]|uniref:HEPN domain-containing protein n=1 Tax=Dyadobacter bucti TaxID=2572203 RepID=UPI003F7124A0